MSEHTPGPWFFHRGMNGDSDHGTITKCADFDAHTIYIGAGDKLLIAQVEAYDHRGNAFDGYPRVADFEENKANACLIAAAPDMLAALRRSALALAFAAESSRAMQDDYEAVSAAIAKATGSAS